MVQNILVLLVFAGAVAYVARMIYRNFQPRSGCAQGCGKCAIDFEKLARDVERKRA